MSHDTYIIILNKYKDNENSNSEDKYSPLHMNYEQQK